MNLYPQNVKETMLAGMKLDIQNPNHAKIAKMIECNICRGFLAVSMISPLRCPGMDYREIDGKQIAYTATGIPWNEYVQKFEDQKNKEYEDYKNTHKEHLIEHGVIK